MVTCKLGYAPTRQLPAPSPTATVRTIRSCHVIVLREVKYARIPAFVHPRASSTYMFPSAATRSVMMFGEYIYEDRISHLIFREEGRFVKGSIPTSNHKERARFAQSLHNRELYLELDELASRSFNVDDVREIFRMGDRAQYGREWMIRIMATSTLLPKFLIAASPSPERMQTPLRVMCAPLIARISHQPKATSWSPICDEQSCMSRKAASDFGRRSGRIFLGSPTILRRTR